MVELLVATAIGSLLVAMVATVLFQVVNGWQRNSDRLQAEVDVNLDQDVPLGEALVDLVYDHEDSLTARGRSLDLRQPDSTIDQSV